MTTPFPTPHVTLDVKGVSCPGPILSAKRLVDDLAEGEVLLLVSDCAGTESDLFAWARGNQVVGADKRPDGSQGYYIRKGTADHPPAQADLDLRGVVCPGPIVEAKRLLGSMQPGEVLRLVSDCAGVRGDIAGWADATGHSIIATHEVATGTYEFFIRRGPNK
jgi:tRNA 2-thiouridine synthesizing protein A